MSGLAARERHLAAIHSEEPPAWMDEADQALNVEYGEDRNLLPVIDASEFDGVTVPPREWMLEGWEPLGSTTYLTGLGASGKSLLTQQRLTCSAVGLPLFGIPTRPGVSIYVTCEDTQDELHRRQERINAALGVSWQDLRGRLKLSSLKGMPNNELCVFDLQGRMSTTPRWRQLLSTVSSVGATHVGLDNVAHFFAGNENIRNQVAAFTGLLDRLAVEINGGVLLLGHPNKAGAEFSGSTAWENQVRSRIYLSLEEPDASGQSDPNARRLSNSKPNYSSRGQSIRFVWRDWAFYREQDAPTDTAAELLATTAASADNAIFLACLAERTKQRRPVSERRSPTFAPTEFAKMAEAKGVSKERFEAAMDRLFRVGAIERAELWRGPDRKPVYGLRATAGNGQPDLAEMAQILAGDGAGNGAGNAREMGTESADFCAGNGAGNAGNTHTPYVVGGGAAPPGPAAPPTPSNTQPDRSPA